MISKWVISLSLRGVEGSANPNASFSVTSGSPIGIPTDNYGAFSNFKSFPIQNLQEYGSLGVDLIWVLTTANPSISHKFP